MTITTKTPALTEITDAWADWMASSKGTTKRFTSIFDYANHNEIGSDQCQYQCQYVVQDIVYGTGSYTPTTAAATMFSEDYNNNTTADDPGQIFTRTVEYDRTMTWKTTTSVSIGTTVTVGLKLDVFSASDATTVTTDLTQEKDNELSDKQTWTLTNTFTVPAHSRVTAKAILEVGSFDVSYVQWVSITGYVAIWFNDQISIAGWPGSHWLFYVPIERIFDDASNLANKIITSADQLANYRRDPNGISARVAGQLSGTMGMSAYVDLQQSAPHATMHARHGSRH